MQIPDRYDEPEGDTTAKTEQSFYLSAGTPASVIAADGDGEIRLTVCRPADCRGSETGCTPHVGSPSGIVLRVEEAVFDEEALSAEAIIIYNGAAIAPGSTTKLHVSVSPAAAEGMTQTDITLLRPSAAPECIKGIYRMGATSFEAEARIRRSGNVELFTISSPDFEIAFEINGSNIRVLPSPDVEDMELARDKLLLNEGYAPYIYYMCSTVTPDEGRYNLALCRNGVPGVEYFIAGESDWEDAGEYYFEDGWFLPVIAINAQLLDPAGHRWPVWMQRNKKNPGLLRVVDPYRGDSPLSQVNTAVAGSILLIDASKPSAVYVPEQNSAFACPDVFGFTVRTGSSTDEPGYVDSDGSIILPLPLCNFNSKGEETPFGSHSGKIRRSAFVSRASMP